MNIKQTVVKNADGTTSIKISSPIEMEEFKVRDYKALAELEKKLWESRKKKQQHIQTLGLLIIILFGIWFMVLVHMIAPSSMVVGC